MKKKLTLQEEAERYILLYSNDEIGDSPERRGDKKMIREIIEKNRNNSSKK